MLVPNKMQHVICTGNVGDQYQELCGLAPNVCMVQGDFDLEYDFPPTQVVQVGQFRIGVLHGHQMLPYGGTGSSKATAAGDDDPSISAPSISLTVGDIISRTFESQRRNLSTLQQKVD